MTARTQQNRTRAYLARLRASGGRVVAVRMTKSQLDALDALRLPSESRTACVNRLVADREFQRQFNAELRALRSD